MALLFFHMFPRKNRVEGQTVVLIVGHQCDEHRLTKEEVLLETLDPRRLLQSLGSVSDEF